MDNKPVLFIIVNNLDVGGMQALIGALAGELKNELDIHIVVYRDKGRMWDEYERSGFKLHFVRLRGKWDFKGILKISRLLVDFRADIVHTHSLGGNISGMLAAGIAQVPVRIGHVHTIAPHWYAKGLLHRKKQIMEESLVHGLFTDKIIVGNSESGDYFSRHTGISSDKLFILHNGLDFRRLAPTRPREEIRAELGVKPEQILIGFVGRMVEGKGVGLFLEFAAQAVRSERERHRFVLVGGGDEAERFRKMAFDLGLENAVVFTGEKLDVGNYLNALDIFFFASRPGWEGGTPYAALEACSFELPIIARESAPMKEIEAYYPRIAYLRKDSDPLSLIRDALALEKPDMSAFLAEFDIRNTAGRLKSLYLELLQAKGVRE